MAADHEKEEDQSAKTADWLVDNDVMACFA